MSYATAASAFFLLMLAIDLLVWDTWLEWHDILLVATIAPAVLVLIAVVLELTSSRRE